MKNANAVSETQAERPVIGRFGPKADYRGALVMLDYSGRRLLGEIKDVQRNEVLGAYIATVKHFNGEPWPIQPALMALFLIPRR